MLSTVPVPITLAGFFTSIRGSRAARLNKASAEIPSPGAIAPPINSPLGDTTSKVVAVPISTMMHALLNRSYAATQFTMRSAPTSDGLSVSTGSPVLTPGSMNIGRILKKCSQTLRSVESSGGTTDEITIPDTSVIARPPRSNRFRSIMPNSSFVRVSGVVILQCATSSGA